MASKERDLLIAIGVDPHQKDGPVLPLDLATIQRLLRKASIQTAAAIVLGRRHSE
jgi:hypothetical protein